METLVALAISVIVVGPVGAWMMMVFTVQTPVAAGFTDAGQSRTLNTWVTRDVSSAEILSAAGPHAPATELVACAGTPAGATSLLNVYDLGVASSVVVYGTVPNGDGSTDLFRWSCDLTAQHVVQDEVLVLQGVSGASAVCEDAPDTCATVTFDATLDTGHVTSITASRRASAAALQGFGGSSVPVVFVEETSRTSRAPGSPLTLGLRASAVDADTDAEDIVFSWSVSWSGPGAVPASLSTDVGISTEFSTLVAGQYSVTLTAFDGLNTASLSFSIEVENASPAIQSASCLPDDDTENRFNCEAVANDSDTDDGVGYQWSYATDASGGQAVINGSSATIDIDPAIPGLVLVELRVSDQEGGQAVRYIELERNVAESGPIVPSPELVVLPGVLPRLLSTGGDAASRTGTFTTAATDTTSWVLLDAGGNEITSVSTEDPGFDRAAFEYTFAQDASGDHTIRRVGSAGNTDELRFRVNAPPTPQISFANPQVNAPVTVTFSDSGGDDYGVASYSWDFSALGPFAGLWTGSGESVSHRFEQPGTYVVRLVAVDIDGDSAESSRTIVVPGVPATPDPPTWDGNRVTFEPVPGATGYQVTFVHTGADACLRTVARSVPGGGPFEAADSGNNCDNPLSTSATLIVETEVAESPESAPAVKP